MHLHPTSTLTDTLVPSTCLVRSMRVKAAIEGRHPKDAGDGEREWGAMPCPVVNAIEPEPCGGGVGLALRINRKARARLRMAHQISPGSRSGRAVENEVDQIGRAHV